MRLRALASILLITLNVTLWSQDIRIYFEDDPEAKRIDFGMRYFIDDQVVRTFVIENNSNNVVYTGDQLPTNGTFELSSGDDRFVHFVNVERGIEEIPPGARIKRQIVFFPNNDQATDSIGFMEGKLALGVSLSPSANSVLDTVQFNVFGIATDKKIDMWPKNLDLDSIYVNHPTGIETEINFRNNYTEKLSIESQELEVVTSELAGKEFFIEDLVFPVELQPRTDPGNGIEKNIISYKPSDIGPDTAYYRIFTKPEGDFSDSTEIIETRITGFGVEQEFQLKNCNHSFEQIEKNVIKINVGRVALGQTININGELENTGNFEPVIIDQFIQNSFTYLIIDSVLNSNEKFNKEQVDYFEISVVASERGDFQIDYVIQTDLLDRNIRAIPNQDLSRIYFQISGNATQASIFVNQDTLYFGSLSLSETCPNSNSRQMFIKNTGNDVLQFDIYPETDALGIFDVQINDEDRIIDPSETVSATVRFQPVDIREYDYDLIIESNLFGIDSLKRIPMIGEGVEPLPTIFATEDQSFFPGTRIDVPILVEGERIEISDRFDATLAYNPSLLVFDGFTTIGTASENSDNYSDINSNDINGELTIDINMPSPQNFDSKDTLIVFHFRTFLGNSLNTSITVENPRFGGDNCDDLVDVELQNGLFELDSLCGLAYKVDRLNNSSMSFLAPNPANDKISFTFFSNENQVVEVYIQDALGNTVYRESSEVIVGMNPIELDLKDLNPGSYFTNVICKNELHTRKFNIIK